MESIKSSFRDRIESLASKELFGVVKNSISTNKAMQNSIIELDPYELSGDFKFKDDQDCDDSISKDFDMCEDASLARGID